MPKHNISIPNTIANTLSFQNSGNVHWSTFFYYFKIISNTTDILIIDIETYDYKTKRTYQ